MNFDIAALTKMELRKLNALKKSIGDALGETTFAKWLKDKPKKANRSAGDKYADRIVEVLTPLILDKKISIPKGGYKLRRGRGRVIVEDAVKVAVKTAKPTKARKKKA